MKKFQKGYHLEKIKKTRIKKVFSIEDNLLKKIVELLLKS